MGYRNDNYPDMRHGEQRHVHELQGSVKIAERENDPHNHRFCTVTGPAIPCDGNHIHEVEFHTDFYDDHCHEFCGKTGLAIPVGNGRHVHFIESVTSVNDGHRHEFEAATLIENPIGKECIHEDYNTHDHEDYTTNQRYIRGRRGYFRRY